MPTIENLSTTISLKEKKQGESYDFEMGRLLCAGGNFQKCLPHLKKAMSAFLKQNKFSSYFSCYQMMILALNELMEVKVAKLLHQEVQTVCRTYNISMTPMVLNCSAYYNIYITKDLDTAKQQLNSSLKIAFDKHDHYIKTGDRLKQNTCRYHIIMCLYFYSIYYLVIKDFKNCIQELNNLKILLKDHLKLKEDVELDNARTDNVQELQMQHNILEDLKKNYMNLQKIQLGIKYIEASVKIQYKQNYTLANKLLWELYEEANKINQTFLIPDILCAMSYCYLGMKNKKSAQMFFNLAKKHSNKDRQRLFHYMEKLEKQEEWNQTEEDDTYDLIFNIKDHLIVEKQKGCIELKNQFILMDLLKLFLLNPGVPYSKESIIKTIWKQDYLPEVHDNKIYVTIKRLREMIEINSCKPHYIRRNNAGYHFSQQAKVLVKQ